MSKQELLDLIKRHEYEGITNELLDTDYHGSAGVSSSQYKEFKKSPAHFEAAVNSPKEDTEAMFFGRMLHSRFLEYRKVLVPPKVDKRTNAGKELYAAWEKENEGALIYDWFATHEANVKAVATIEGMVDKLRSHPTVARLFEQGQAEQTGYVRDAETGVYIKARADWILPDGTIVDLKSTSESADPERFEKTIFDYGYWLSAGWYCRVFSQLLHKPIDTFLFVAVEKKAPYGISVSVLKDHHLALAQEQITRDLLRLKECQERNEWPGYPVEIREVGIPDWAVRREQKRVEVVA